MKGVDTWYLVLASFWKEVLSAAIVKFEELSRKVMGKEAQSSFVIINASFILIFSWLCRPSVQSFGASFVMVNVLRTTETPREVATFEIMPR